MRFISFTAATTTGTRPPKRLCWPQQSVCKSVVQDHTLDTEVSLHRELHQQRQGSKRQMAMIDGAKIESKHSLPVPGWLSRIYKTSHLALWTSRFIRSSQSAFIVSFHPVHLRTGTPPTVKLFVQAGYSHNRSCLAACQSVWLAVYLSTASCAFDPTTALLSSDTK